MRSRTGCLTCRARKLKCDEQKPRCSQCRKGNRECRPCEGIIFRHQQNASMNNKDGDDSGISTGAGAGAGSNDGDGDGGSGYYEESPRCGRGNLKGFYSYKNTFNKDSVWLDIPKHVIFVDNSDPYAEDLEATLHESEAAMLAENAQNNVWDHPQNSDTGADSIGEEAQRGLEALSTAASHDSFSYPSLDAGRPHHQRQHTTSMPADSVSSFDHSVELSPPPPVSSGPSPSHARSTLPPQASPPVSIASSSTSHHNNTINFLLNPSHSLSPSVDTNTNIQQSAAAPRSSSLAAKSSVPRAPTESRSTVQAETDYEIAFLLRHYAEAPGQWMDLFDLGTYFGSYVPVRALNNPLLKYAMCAYAAKQLGLVKSKKAPAPSGNGGGACSKQSALVAWSEKDRRDWYWCGAKYYDKAIQFLMKELQRDEGPPPLSTPEAFGQWQAAELCEDNENPRKRRRRYFDSHLSNGVHSDEVLAATAILSVYEFLDATGPAWNRHLSGVKSLLDVAEVGVLPLEQRPLADPAFPAPKRSGLSKARKAIFWNFARQDYLAAFINESHTRLNTDDLLLWTEAGLQLDNMGFVCPSNTSVSGYPEGDDVMKEDLISNALIWILSKIVNFISAGDNVHLDHNQSVDTGPLGVSQQVLLERWYRLEAELDAWHRGLPDTFQPCARIFPSQLPGYEPGTHDDDNNKNNDDDNDNDINNDKGDNDGAILPEVWHCIPMCSATMQHYHMARIVLLINKPHDSTSRRSTIANRLNSYRSIESEIRFHCREILGISMSHPHSTVRIHSLQPLFVSGQCLTEPYERRLIVHLLRDIEADLGWATEYRVQQLLRDWGWDESGDLGVL